MIIDLLIYLARIHSEMEQAAREASALNPKTDSPIAYWRLRTKADTLAKIEKELTKIIQAASPDSRPIKNIEAATSPGDRLNS